MKYKVGAYVRISTEEAAQVQEGSISSQKHRLHSWVEIKNSQQEAWGEIVEVYADEGISAKDMNRPAFQKMMRDLRKGKINLILVTELSRLSRSIMDFCHILDELKAHKAGFLSIKEQFDTSTPAGEMMVFNMINLAQFERKQVAERVALNFHSRAMRGLLNGGHPPLGYDKDAEKRCTYVVNEEEASRVREIFQIYLREGSLAKAMVKINELGIKPKQRTKRKSSQEWNVKNLNQILRNKTYIGMREVNSKYRNEDPSMLKPFQKYSVVKASWPGIVDPDVFSEVQQLLDESSKLERDRLSKSVQNVYWLSGVIRCPDCGKSYVGACAHGRNQVHRYYVHPGKKSTEGKCKFRRIKADEIESKIESHLGEILKINGHFDEIQENIEKSFKLKSKDLAAEQGGLKKRESQLTKELDQLITMKMGSQGIAEEIFQERLEKLGMERKAIQNRLAELSEQIEESQKRSNESQRIRDRVTEFQKGWKKATGAEKKRLGRRLLSRLIPTENGLEVFYFTEKEVCSDYVGENQSAVGDGVEKINDSRTLRAKNAKSQNLDSNLVLAFGGSDIMKKPSSQGAKPQPSPNRTCTLNASGS
ncbi:MAG: recombinase family protein, partial [Bdellovibrionales bacterium]|nr:recombinase family protein [Bdellovibrionales bacterium]